MATKKTAVIPEEEILAAATEENINEHALHQTETEPEPDRVLSAEGAPGDADLIDICQTDSESANPEGMPIEDAARNTPEAPVSQTGSGTELPGEFPAGSDELTAPEAPVSQTDSDLEEKKPEESPPARRTRKPRAKKSESDTTAAEPPGDASDGVESPEKKPRRRAAARPASPVVSIDERPSVETEADKARNDLLDLVESLKTKRILTGTIQGIERPADHPSRSLAVIYHGDIKVIIPAEEAVEPPEDFRGRLPEDVLHYMVTKRLGAEVDYIIKGIDAKAGVVDVYYTDAKGQFTSKEYICDTDWTIREMEPSEGYLLDTTEHTVGAAPGQYTVEHNTTANAVTETVIKGSIRLIKHIDAELETSENAPTPQAEAEIPAATDPSAPEGSAYFVSPDAAALEDAQETAASDDAKDTAEPAAEETPMPDQADTETPAESEPEAADTLIPGQNEAEPEPENGSVPAAEFNPSGNAGIIEQPEAGAMFQLYLSGAGSYDAAKDSERDLLVTDENGVVLSKDLPYGRYTVHQIEGQEGQAFVPDFTVFISSDEHLYSYILNNQTITSFIRVEKRDAETGKIIPAAGIGFQVRDLTSGELISQTVYYPAPVTISTFYTADDGTLMLPCELPYGRYELIEVTTCHGYVLDTAPVPFAVDGSEAVVTVTKSNMAQKGVIRIQKTGEVFSSVVNEGSIFRPVYENAGLPGAVFDIAAAEDIYTPDGTLRAKAGDIVDTVTTQSDGMAASKALYLGKYVITEKQAPHGMALQTEPHTVELVYAGQEVTVTELRADMYNERQRVEISLVKTMETDTLFGIGQRDELTHVTFGLYAAEKLVAADGSSIPQDGLIEMVSLNKDGKAMCKTDLPFGRFYLQEISTDSHYQLGDTKYPVSFDYAGQDKKLVKLIANEGAVIENKLIYGSVSGLKVDANDKPLSGAVMGLFAASETKFTKDTALLTAVSAEDGRFRFEKIPAGNWLVREIEQPKGFVLSEELFPVTVKEQGQVIEIKIANKLIRGSVTLTKYDADYPENKLSGAVFEVYRDVNGNKALDKDDVLLGTMEESSAGVYWMKNLEYGGVLVREKTAPEGFIPDEKAYYVEIDTDGKTYTVENEAGKGFINHALKGSLKIIKTTSDGKKEGFAFRITGANGYDMTFTTDAKGEIFIEKLRIGEYTVTELKNSASEGYKIADPVKITLVANETLTVKIHNDKTKVDVPKTGDDADLILWISLLGLAAAGAGCTAFFYLKKRRTSKHIAAKK